MNSGQSRDKFVKSRSVADLRYSNTSLTVAFAGQNGQGAAKGARNAPTMRYPDEAMAPLCIPGTEVESTEFKKPKHERFQKLFTNVPSTELLVSRFSCAYVTEKGALIQGQLYVSRNWICFYSNIFGMKKTIEIPVSSVKAIKKERTAKIFPNAVGIVVDSGEHYLFGSLISRNNTHQLLSTLLERSRIIRDYCMTAGGISVAVPDLSTPKEFVDASAGDDHGYSTSSSEDESSDESVEMRHPPSANGAWIFPSTACVLDERRSKDRVNSASLKWFLPFEIHLRRFIRLQLLVIVLIAMLLISFVYLEYGSVYGSLYNRQEHRAKDDIASIDRTSALLMETITSLQQVRSDIQELRDVFTAM